MYLAFSFKINTVQNLILNRFPTWDSLQAFIYKGFATSATADSLPALVVLTLYTRENGLPKVGKTQLPFLVKISKVEFTLG